MMKLKSIANALNFTRGANRDDAAAESSACDACIFDACSHRGYDQSIHRRRADVQAITEAPVRFAEDRAEAWQVGPV